jgi:tRNA-2-methylthio-N6-dimethylallyladenosine synthase
MQPPLPVDGASLTFHIFPFGCQMNRHDAEVLAGALEAGGYAPAASPEEADVVLYTTCSVRDHAEQRVWSHLGRWRGRRESGAMRALGVIGCMAERLGAKIVKRMPHVDIVAGPRRLAEVPSFVAQVIEGRGPVVATGASGNAKGAPDATGACDDALDPVGASRPRAFQAYLAAMRGCDGGCTYCVVPRVRGRETSVPPERVVRAAEGLVEKGAVEITLLGQNIDRYGLGLAPKTSLAELLRRVVGVDGLRRLRFVTSHPRDITDDLLRAMADLPNVCPYLHVPAQSGADRVLERMRRGYTRGTYERVLERSRELVPGVEVASDFIVGFPGETDADFGETLSLVRSARLQGAFIFKYSPRPGTPAARLADDVPDHAKRERHRLLSEAQRAVQLDLNRALVGSEVEVLAEGKSRIDPARWTGRTPSGRIAAFTCAAGRDATGEFVRVRVEDATPLVLLGAEAAP